MKFSLNGALTIGTLDGANVEIREEVGPENFFLFGLTAEEVLAHKKHGYFPKTYYEENHQLRAAIDMIASGQFSRGNSELFRPLINALCQHDEYMLFADYASYIEAQGLVGQTYRDRKKWANMSVLNVARMGKFSSDRAINDWIDCCSSSTRGSGFDQG